MGVIRTKSGLWLWQRKPDEFAVRIDETDILDKLRSGVIVETGTRAMFFLNGEYLDTLPAGKWTPGEKAPFPGTFGKLWDAFSEAFTGENPRNHVAIILIDSGDMPIEFSFGGFFSKDNARLDCLVSCTAHVENENNFYRNTMKHSSSFLIDDIKTSVSGRLKSKTASIVRNFSPEELRIPDKFEDELSTALLSTGGIGSSLTRKGIELRLEYAEFTGSMLEGVSIAEERILTESTEADLNSRMRKLRSNAEQAKLSDENSMSEFLDDMEKKGLLRQEEKRRFIMSLEKTTSTLGRELDEKDEDHAIRRNQYLQLLDRQMELELKREEKKIRDFSKSEELEELDHKIALQQKDGLLTTTKAEQGAALEDISGEAALRQVQREEDARRLKDETDFSALAKMQRHRHQLEQEELDADLHREKERLEFRSSASSRALMSILSSAEQERFGKFLEMDIVKNLTEEQIVALKAGESAAVAEALKAKYSADPEELKRFLDIMETRIKDQKESADRIERLNANMTDVAISQAAGQGLGRVRGTAAGKGDPRWICQVCSKPSDPELSKCPYCGGKTVPPVY